VQSSFDVFRLAQGEVQRLSQDRNHFEGLRVAADCL
jgi:hypothetical protein